MTYQPGGLMSAETQEAPAVFARAVLPAARDASDTSDAVLAKPSALYTIARGSSDAAANILAYEAMRELNIPVTSLPPSVFSVQDGVDMTGAAALVVSQSGASPDLVACAKGIRAKGGRVFAITNQPDSAVEAEADATLAMDAGPELAVPATKSVIGSIAAGMAFVAAMKPAYRATCEQAAQLMGALDGKRHPNANALRATLLRSRHVYVIGRGAGFGAAIETALKIKETSAIHAEAYSASEVLHGPLQLATNPLSVLILDTEEEAARESLDQAEARFRDLGVDVHRISPHDLDIQGASPAAAAAMLLYLIYPVIHDTALALGHDPDRPVTLSKVTETV